MNDKINHEDEMRKQGRSNIHIRILDIKKKR